MPRITRSFPLLALLACGAEDFTGPIAMSPSEVGTLFTEIVEALDATDTPIFLHVTSMGLDRTRPPETYNGSADCPQGGSVSNVGGGEVSETTLDVTFTPSFDRCRSEHFTVTGTLAITALGGSVGGADSLLVDVLGDLQITGPNDRRGTCAVDYGWTAAVDHVQMSFTPRGTICGYLFTQLIGFPLSFGAGRS